MNAGQDRESRPVGLTILAWWHLLGGALVVLGMLALFIGLVALGMATDAQAIRGLPLDWLALIVLALLLGVGGGIGILRRRSAAWVWCTLFYFLVFSSQVAYYVSAPEPSAPPIIPVESLVIESIAGTMGSVVGLFGGVVALAIYVYLFTRPVRSYFGLGELPLWKPLAGHLVLGVVIVGATVLLTAGNEADRNVTLIQKIGEGRVASEEDVRFLLERLERGNAEERLSAAWALGQTGRTDMLEQLTRTALEDPNADVRVNAIATIDLLGGETVESVLLDLLADEAEPVRAAALRGLADSSSPEVAPSVGPLLVDGGEATRALAVDVLGSSGDPRAIEFLVQVADDDDSDVRSRVAFALGKLRDPSSIPTLVTLLGDDQWEVRANAVQALGMIGDPSARRSIEPLTDDSNSMVRQAADAALAKLN